jgi:hypothetical protein
MKFTVLCSTLTSLRLKAKSTKYVRIAMITRLSIDKALKPLQEFPQWQAQVLCLTPLQVWGQLMRSILFVRAFPPAGMITKKKRYH